MHEFELMTMSLQEKLKARMELLEELVELAEDGLDLDLSDADSNKTQRVLDMFEKVQHVDHYVITELLTDTNNKSAEREAELVGAANYWKAEAEKWKQALFSYRQQNRI